MDSIAPKRWFEERPGRWVSEKEWPSPNVKPARYHLGENALEDAPHSIALSISSSQHCGMAGGEFFPFAFGDELPAEQTDDDELSLCFDGQPIEIPKDILGAPKVSLKAQHPIGHLSGRLRKRQL